MSRASTQTILSLDRFARILGIDPMHFAQGVSTLRPELACPDLWYQMDWQDDKKVSREQVAVLIAEAERDLADVLGYWPVPQWIVDERQAYPRPYDRTLTGYNGDIRGRWKSLRAKWGHVLYGGQRATSPLNLGMVVWDAVDADGDGFEELARFQFVVPGTLDVCEVKAYFREGDRTDPSSTGADPVWEVRPLKLSLSGVTLTVWIDVWNLFRPDLQEELSPSPIAADAPGPLNPNYVPELDFYRVYNDPEHQVQFLWSEDVNCTDPACSWATQDGCLRVQNRRNGLVVPQPGTYDSVAGTFSQSIWPQCREPNAVRLWYKAGYTPERAYLCDELTPFWAKTIAILAISRCEWPICTCSNVQLVTDKWREDMAEFTKDRSYTVLPSELGNPFGTRVGEVMAWKRLKGRGRQKGQAVIV